MSRTLVLGGARSGKSAFAERLAAASGQEVVYLATARAGDAEMGARIAHHRARRSPHWGTVEEPHALAGAVRRWSAPGRLILVDCLTLWLSNLMFDDGGDYPEVGELALPARFDAQRAAFLRALAEAKGDVILVSNEVGMGIVPVGAVSRRFADEAGRLNQAVARRCENAVMLVAGLPLALKGARCWPA
jgi:adenosylcobinamide kinase/adenosylcobinamide-phosphate guanylyltransferase